MAGIVANAIVGRENVGMSIYPCGCGNDFVKYYAADAAKEFLKVRELVDAVDTKIDLLKIDDRYSLNVVNFGFDTTVARTMIKVKNKKIIGGKNSYNFGVFTAVIKAMKSKCTVTVDGEQLNNKELLLCTIANGKYVGGQFKCAPRSVNNDGLAEVCLVKPISRFRFIEILKPYTNGLHLDNQKYSDCIVYRRGKKIEIDAPEGFAYSLDGEIITNNHFIIEVIPEAITFAVPEKLIKQEQKQAILNN